MAQTLQPALKAVYDTPATNWEEEALPLGNGNMGAMVFGDVFNETIQTNEKTLWSGGPGEDADYDGGHRHTKESAHKALKDFRTTLQENMTQFTAGLVPGGLKDYPGNVNYYDEKGGHGDYDGSGCSTDCLERKTISAHSRHWMKSTSTTPGSPPSYRNPYVPPTTTTQAPMK